MSSSGREWSEVPEGHRGTESLSALPVRECFPLYPSGEISHSRPSEPGCLVPGLVSLGTPQGLGWPGLWKAPAKD